MNEESEEQASAMLAIITEDLGRNCIAFRWGLSGCLSGTHHAHHALLHLRRQCALPGMPFHAALLLGVLLHATLCV
jgi:hypothetical protein